MKLNNNALLLGYQPEHIIGVPHAIDGIYLLFLLEAIEGNVAICFNIRRVLVLN